MGVAVNLGRRLVSLLLVAASPLMANAHENCEIKIPPRGAGITASHGTFFFAYPPAVGTTYSGCQTLWDEKGNKWMVLQFEKGRLVQYKENEPTRESGGQTCRYEQMRLALNQNNECPAYEDVSSGLRTMSKSDEPVVPPERDPRR